MEYVNIIMIQIINRNLGDGVISDCARYLCQKVLPILKKNCYRIIPYNIYSEDYELLIKADVVIFCGGGIIKYKYERFYSYIAEILKYTQQYNIPVFMNAVGVEGFDQDNPNCRLLKQALNSGCIKEITVRDDIETLKHKYIENSSITLKSVYDPAIWVPQVYHIDKQIDSDIIGLGIARYKIFYDNGILNINKEYLLEFWKNLINLLECHNIKWKVFTNGLKADEDFAIEVLQYIGISENYMKYKVARPTEPRELVETISRFRVVVACRLHANIIAYSLGVPSIGLVWNDKLKMWGNKIGYPERMVLPDELDANVVWEKLNRVLGERTKKIATYNKNTGKRELKKFLKKYGYSRMIKSMQIDWKNHLMATALGGENFLYCNMNIPEMLKKSYEAGFRWMELDVRLSKDDKLVCVNGWNEAIYSKLNIPVELYKSGILEKDFLKMKYYGKYATANLNMILNTIRRYEDIKLVLDIGKPEKNKIEIFMLQLKKEIPEDIFRKMYIRLQREPDIQIVEHMGLPIKIMYYIGKNQEVNEIIKICKRYSITWITMKADIYNDDILAKLKQNGIQSCIFSVDTLTEAQHAIISGVDLVSTHYLSVNLLESLG